MKIPSKMQTFLYIVAIYAQRPMTGLRSSVTCEDWHYPTDSPQHVLKKSVYLVGTQGLAFWSMGTTFLLNVLYKFQDICTAINCVLRLQYEVDCRWVRIFRTYTTCCARATRSSQSINRAWIILFVEGLVRWCEGLSWDNKLSIIAASRKHSKNMLRCIARKQKIGVSFAMKRTLSIIE